MRAVSTAASTIRHALGAGLEALVIVGIIGVLAFGVALANGHPAGAGSVFAAKGGNGHGNGGGSAVVAPAWVSASPGTAAAGGSRVDVTGCGFEFAPVEIRIVHSAGPTEAFMVGVWSTGCMAGTYFTTQEPGTYSILAYQTSGSHGSSTSTLMASTFVAVE